MLPVLISVGPFTLYTFGVCLLIGFFLSLFVVWKKGKEENFDETQIFDIVLISSFFALIGARIFYIVSNFTQLGGNPASWLNIIGQPGYSYHGALVAGLMSIVYQTKKRKWDFYEFGDVLVIGMSLFGVFLWLGAFLNGSALGRVTDSFLGMQFPGQYDKRIPVQLYGMLGFLGLFSYLWWVEAKYRTFEWYKAYKSSAKAGFVFFNFLIFSGIIGMINSFMAEPGMMLGFLPATFLFWLLLFVIGLVGLYVRSSRNWQEEMRSWRTKSRVPNRRRQLLQNHKKLGEDIL